MDVNNLKELYAEVDQRMGDLIEHSRRELSGVRTGRASIAILDGVDVDAYGASVPLNQVASLSVPEPMLIAAQPFDPSLSSAIEKAIQAANLGLNPAIINRWSRPWGHYAMLIFGCSLVFVVLVQHIIEGLPYCLHFFRVDGTAFKRCSFVEDTIN